MNADKVMECGLHGCCCRSVQNKRRMHSVVARIRKLAAVFASPDVEAADESHRQHQKHGRRTLTQSEEAHRVRRAWILTTQSRGKGRLV